MTDITIPPEALEAAAIEMAPAPWSIYAEDAQEHFRRKARAACLAMLRAWETDTHRMIVGTALDEVAGTYPAIILPLPKETSE